MRHPSPRRLARSLAQRGGYALDAAALREAVEAFDHAYAKARGGQLHKELSTQLCRQVVRAYLRYCTPVDQPQHAPHPDTTALTALAVGAYLERPNDTAAAVWRSRMDTARKHMDNREARWQCGVHGDRMRVTRLADGARPQRDPTANARAVFLASVPVNCWRVGTCFKNRQSLATSTKVTARKLLGVTTAEWTARTNATGKVSVMRIR